VGLSDALNMKEPQTMTTGFATVLFFNAGKLFEDACSVFTGNTQAVVDNGNDNLFVCFGECELNPRRAVMAAVFQRIVQQAC